MIVQRLSPKLQDLELESLEQLRLHFANKEWPAPSLMGNLVATIDGTFWGNHNSSRDLSNQWDLQALLGYRDAADVVLVTAKTARMEHYKRSSNTELAIVSRNGNFEQIPATFDEAAGPTTSKVHLLVPSASARKVHKHYQQPWISLRKVGRLKSGAFSPFRLAFALTQLGGRRVLVEAGPTFTTWLIQNHALQYLSLTIVNSGDLSPLEAAKPALDQLQVSGAVLEWAEVIEGTIFTRWSQLSPLVS